MRIYSNYNQNDYDLICEESQKLGFTPSSFQNYCVMLYIMQNTNNRKGATNIAALTTKMLNTLNSLPTGKEKTFIVSSLISTEWPDLSRSEKMTLAKALANHVRNNPSSYSIDSMTVGKTTVYKKK